MFTFGTTPTLESTQANIWHQTEAFNTLITHSSPQQIQMNSDQLDRIHQALQASLGFLEGLLETYQKQQGPSTAFDTGKKVGSIAGSGVTKASGMTGVVGAVAGYVTNHMWIVWVGGGAAALCLAADCGIITYAAYQSKQADDKVKVVEKIQKIQQVQTQAKNICDCVEKFIHCIQENLDSDLYTHEASECLKKYQLFPVEQQSRDVYNQMISQFVQNLPNNHQIFVDLNQLHQSSKLLNKQEIFLSKNQLDSQVENREVKLEESEEILENDQEVNIDSIESNKLSYQESLNQCQKTIKQVFHLPPTQSIKFIELYTNNDCLRYTKQGAIQKPVSNQGD